MPEFTGERVIPGEVDIDLWNEHFSRYAFAARLASGKRVLDIGCGAGYGSAELARVAATVTAIDISESTVRDAAERYPLPNLTFETADALQLPYAANAFDLLIAFEVIEHLNDWRAFLKECHRILTPGGQLMVSTPNKLYYAEAREQSGPNPFHVHEFTFDEFRRELEELFPSVRIFLQNHAASIVFQPVATSAAAPADLSAARANATPDEANFFVAVCSKSPQTGSPMYVYIPATANVLRQREQHIALLEDELRQKDDWLRRARNEQAEMVELFRRQAEDLQSRTDWAKALQNEIDDLRVKYAALDAEPARLRALLETERAETLAVIEAYQNKVAELEQDLDRRHKAYTQNEQRLLAEVDARANELAQCVSLLDKAELTVMERTHWALDLQGQLGDRDEMLRSIAGSKWLRFGRRIGLGPDLSQL